MKHKLLKFSLIAFIAMSLVACGQKKDDKMPDMFNSLVSLYAGPVEGNYLPLEMFTENGEMYVRYIKNGKPLDKINLAYSHSEKEEYETIYYFDEIVNGKKNGEYGVPAEIKDAWGGIDKLLYINKNNDTICYYYHIPIFKDDIKISSTDLHLAVKQLSEIRTADDESVYPPYDWNYIINFLYLLKHYPASIDYSFDDDNVYTSSDGKLRFHVGYYYMVEECDDFEYPLIMAQYKYGNDVFLIEQFEDYWTEDAEDKYQINFGYQNGIKIHTIPLNNMTYYLVDFALVDGMPMSSNDEDYVLSNGNYLRLYTIENGELKTQKLFNTTKKVLDEIAFMFDGTKMYNEDGTSDFDWNLIKYDKTSKTIFIPLIDGATLTRKYLQYKWDGKYFTYIGIKK